MVVQIHVNIDVNIGVHIGVNIAVNIGVNIHANRYVNNPKTLHSGDLPKIGLPKCKVCSPVASRPF